MLGHYVALAWAVEDASAAERAGQLGRMLSGNGWSAGGRTDRATLWVRRGAAPPVQILQAGAGFLIGDTFPHPEAPPGAVSAAPRSPSQAATWLCRRVWGRYVAILHGPQGMGTAVFKDPLGELDALLWTLDGVTVVASDFTVLPVGMRPPRLRLDWDRIAAYVGLSNAMRMEVLFDGVTAVQPGMLQPLPIGTRATSIWRPTDFIHDDGPEGEAACERLRATVEACTAALAAPRSRILVELSGGLDSALLSGTLGRIGLDGRVAGWVNYVADTREGDERAYARAVTDRLGVTLTEAVKPMRGLEEADFSGLAQGVRPALQAADAPRDIDMAARMEATGADAVLSGQGGDAVFFQMPSVLLADDLLRRRGVRALASPVLADLARRTRRSVWQVLAEAAAARRRRDPLASLVSPLMPTDLSRALSRASHPWFVEAADAPPAKRLQIRALGNAQLYRGDCRRRRAGDLLFPLLSQPVVELCLSIAASELAGGEQDRRLARVAFADRLPECVRARRAKGELGAYYGRMMVESLDFLRPYLLDGVLCDGGVIDRAAVEQALDSHELIRAPETGALLTAVTTEAWLRHWQSHVPDAEAARRKAFG